MAGWLRNASATPHVRLRIRGGTFEGMARSLQHPGDVATAQRVYCETLNVFDRAEYMMHMPGWPTPGRIKALHEHWFTTGQPVAVGDLCRPKRGR